jgi:hypothetical protein
VLNDQLALHDLKRCAGCTNLLPLEAFNRNRAKPSGRQDRCRTCQSAYDRTWRQNHPERTRQRQAASRLRNRDYYRDHALRARHGVTLEQKAQMYADQDGKCAICNTQYPELDVDHNHDTGQVRALLCRTCNRGLGYLKDNPEILRLAAAYLEEHSC